MTDIEKAEILLAKARFQDLEYQENHGGETWYTPAFNTFARMIEAVHNRIEIRFRPDQPWLYPQETREGVSVWRRWKEDRQDVWGNWRLYRGGKEDMHLLSEWTDVQIVAADPRAPQQPPPNDLPPTPKRIIE